ncbi:hypothetical protein V4762_08770 [Thermodesulfobium sp. 4217-1]|uniref:hypothetical protein n=1 Tax=Thermodesulfobium sp. 4217-1 TaxID=3120013 RepID=UPI003221DCE3
MAMLLLATRQRAHFEHKAETTDCLENNVITHILSNTMLEPAFAKMITEVMSTHFSNGFRIDSPIELLRFRRFAAKNFGNELLITDQELIKSISSCGIFFNGKVYVIGNEIENRIRNNVDLTVSGGVEIIFYSSFYTQHEEWLLAGGVISEEMLKEILVKMYPKYVHKTKYFSPKAGNDTELAKIKGEILRIWGDNNLLSFEQLAERLPFIPLDKIKYVLAQYGDFIWNTTGVYTHINKVNVTVEECNVITDYVDVACRRDGYVSLSYVPFEEIAECNYELTVTAIHNAIFEIVLSDKYDRRGKIITRKGDTLDALTIMKEYCRKLDKCSLQNLLDFERELTGETRRWIPMEAGYSVMVRVNKDNYIAEKYVHFDVAKIDSVLDLFVTSEYLTLKSITTFAAFPHCEQAWSLFLLESYCRRFSDRFRFEVLAFNSKNAGVIVRKSCSLSYAQIMADAVAKSDIPLEKTVIEEFLCSNGYIGRRSYAKTDELIEQAKAKRERRN